MPLFELDSRGERFIVQQFEELLIQLEVDSRRSTVTKSTRAHGEFVALMWGWHTTGVFPVGLTPEVIASLLERSAELGGFGAAFTTALAEVQGASASEWNSALPPSLET